MPATNAEEAVWRFADAVTRRDPEGAIAQCDDEVEFFSVLAAPEGKAFHGADGIRRYFSEVADAWDEWRVELHEVAEAPDGRVAVAMTMHVRGKGSGATLTQDVGHLWLVRNDRLWKCTAFRDPRDAFEEAGLRPPEG